MRAGDVPRVVTRNEKTQCTGCCLLSLGPPGWRMRGKLMPHGLFPFFFREGGRVHVGIMPILQEREMLDGDGPLQYHASKYHLVSHARLIEPFISEVQMKAKTSLHQAKKRNLHSIVAPWSIYRLHVTTTATPLLPPPPLPQATVAKKTPSLKCVTLPHNE